MKSLFPLLASSAILLSSCATNNNQTPPPPHSYTISGTVLNLVANNTGLVLQNNGGDNLSITASGTFRFATSVASGSAYSVTVASQPTNPAQQCSVTNGSGTATTNVSNVKVECGHNEWAWMAGSQNINQIGTYGTLGTPAPDNTPGGRHNSATWIDSSGDLWLFGGYGKDTNGNLLDLNDFWKFSAGQWTWMGGSTIGGQSGSYGSLGVPTVYGIPSARFEAVTWTDASGSFWMFGGGGYDSVGHNATLNDLWKYSAGEWTWMGGSALSNQNGVYGTLGAPAAGNIPGARSMAVVWVDSSDNVWLFGGLGYDVSSTTAGLLNDLWRYHAGEWTWMSGAKVANQKGVYGTQGTAAAANVPGARFGAHSWIDGSGNLFLFGGVGYDSNGSSLVLNDLWKYSGGQWTWMGGSKVGDQPGIYGTKGMPSANNIPGARQFGIAWSDAAGNGWLFGGNGYYGPSSVGELNDLWKYSGGQWTWVSGSNVGNQNSTFGAEGILDPGNAPSGRDFTSSWIDPDGNIWLFGGWGQIPGTQGNLNDLWMYMP